jgi:hypothetical protein
MIYGTSIESTHKYQRNPNHFIAQSKRIALTALQVQLPPALVQEPPFRHPHRRSRFASTQKIHTMLRQVGSNLAQRGIGAAQRGASSSSGGGSGSAAAATGAKKRPGRMSLSLPILATPTRPDTTPDPTQQNAGAAAPATPSAAAAAAAQRPPPLPRIKSAEQLSPEELERALPSMFFTTSNLIWSTLVASGVAAAGLVSMVWLGTYIVNAADSMRVPASAAAPAVAEKPKSLIEMIEERKVGAGGAGSVVAAV